MNVLFFPKSDPLSVSSSFVMSFSISLRRRSRAFLYSRKAGCRASAAILAGCLTVAAPATTIENFPHSGWLSSEPEHLTMMGPIVYFTAKDAVYGRELWRSDGTAEGTYMVKDLNPGAPSSEIKELCALGSTLFFVANAQHGLPALWKTDGTEEGTVLVYMTEDTARPFNPGHLVAAGARLFFAGTTAAAGTELWVSDGTTAGTKMVEDSIEGASGSFAHRITSLGSSVLFAGFARPQGNGESLWRSNGTASGTVEVRKMAYTPTGLAAAGQSVFFYTLASGGGRELWRSNGTSAGTQMIKSFSGIGGMLDLTPAGANLFFFTQTGSSSDLWFSNGTAAGTRQISTIPLPFPSFDDSPYLAALNNGTALFALPIPDKLWLYELWKSDGTASGTSLVTGFEPELPRGRPRQFSSAGSLVYFHTNGEINPNSTATLWRSDGTSDGTFKLNADPFENELLSTVHSGVDGEIYFTPLHPAYGHELWRSDGTPDGTYLVKDMTPGNSNEPFPDIAKAGGQLFFKIRLPDGNAALWSSDGTPEGTSVLKKFDEHQIRPGPMSFIPMGNRLAFLDRSHEGIRRLWSSDGTSEGTNEIRPEEQSLYLGYVHGMVPFRGALLACTYYSSFTSQADVWSTDGTEAGTRLIWSRPADIDGTFARMAGATDDYAFFSVQSSTGQSLWKTDGTPEGTAVVRALALNLSEADLDKKAPQFNGKNGFFSAAVAGSSDYELWKSDGTEAGTVLVKELVPGSDSGNPRSFAPVPGGVFFIGGHHTTGVGLWRSDGTAEGTKPVLPGAPTPLPTPDPAAPEVLGARVFYVHATAETGRELWVMDAETGTQATALDVYPGPGSSDPAILGAIGDHLYFAATDHVHGRELWRTNGTVAGTVLVEDVVPGRNSSRPSVITELNGYLYCLVAADSTGTAALRRMTLPAPPVIPTITGSQLTAGSGVQISYTAPPQSSVTLQRSTDLKEWTVVQAAITDESGTGIAEDRASHAGEAYYRLSTP